MSDRNSGGRTIGFFGMIGIVMAGLKLKERWDEYRQLPSEGRITLDGSSSPGLPAYRDADAEDGISLLNTEIPAAVRTKRKRTRKCCVCCGMNCGVFWKAFGIVFAGFAIWNCFKLIKWTLTPSPTGLESMPAYSTSLGCVAAPYIYNNSEISFSVPIGARLEHSIDVHGRAIGTITIAKGPSDLSKIKYDMTLRTDNESLLQNFVVQLPKDDSVKSHVSLRATSPDASSCMRYDVTIYVPVGLKKLQVVAHTATHVRFDPDSQFSLENLVVTLYAMDSNNMIVPHAKAAATNMALEVYRGWIVGEASIINSTVIRTQRGDAVANVHIHPSPAADPSLPSPAFLETVTGAGRTDIFYINDKAYPHRPIKSIHTSSRNADTYLTYHEAEYNGEVKVNSRSFTATGLNFGSNNITEKVRTAWVGDRDGRDELSVTSRGWTGLYF